MNLSMLFSLRTWLARWTRRVASPSPIRKTPLRPRRSFRPEFEHLENRVTPAATVAIAVVDAEAHEGVESDPATFRIFRESGGNHAVTVQYTVGGTATNGVDYQALSGTVVIPHGEDFVDLVIDPIDDAVSEFPESVVVSLLDGPGYDLGAQTEAAATLSNSESFSVLVGQTLTYFIEAGTTLNEYPTITPDSLPSGATFTIVLQYVFGGEHITRGQFTWTPTAGQTGTHPVTYTMADSGGSAELEVVHYVSNLLATPGTAAGLVSQAANQGDCGCGCPEGVRPADGLVSVASSLALGSAFGGAGWAQQAKWTSNFGYAQQNNSGSGMVSATAPKLYQANAGNTVYLVADAAAAFYFDWNGSTWVPRHYGQETLTYNSGSDQFTFTDTTGAKQVLHGFGTGLPANQRGALLSFTDAGGSIVTQIISWTADGKPAEVQRTQTIGADTYTESFQYTYVAGGENAGLVQTAVLRRQVNGGSWATVRSLAYEYYTDAEAHGDRGMLQRLTLKDSSGVAIDTEYYRYYQAGDANGYIGGLKYQFDAASYARLAADFADPTTVSDAQASAYATHYFEYDSQLRATKHVAQGEGCSTCTGGLGTTTYAYSTSAFADNYNAWKYKTVETLPDGTTNTTYSNAYGQTILHVYQESGQQWRTYYEYDTKGREVLRATPAAVTGHNEALADLVGKVSATNYTHLNNTGLIYTKTYYATTTATKTTAGGVAGYLQNEFLRRGEAGTSLKQSQFTYFRNTDDGAAVCPIATSIVYRTASAAGTGPQTTSYAYTWFGTTGQIQSITTTLPTVTTAQNGPNSAASSVVFVDTFGRTTWTKDEDGFITYRAYDAATGALALFIEDVNTTLVGNEPSGWVTPAGGGLHLTTTFEVDVLGRTTKVTKPLGTVDYTVYNDAAHETRTYVGWNAATNTATEATHIVRVDRARGYVETIDSLAPPTHAGGRPTGQEVYGTGTVVTLSRTYASIGGQVTHRDAYFQLSPASGFVYSTAANLGTESTTGSDGHYYRTRYGYEDPRGRLVRVVSPTGTVTRTVFDGLGRVTSTWVGLDDTPTSGLWSPTNTAGTDLVQTAAYVYDGGGVGNGNLTRMTVMPGGGAAQRVTDYAFDFRDRLIAVKSGVESSESTTLNRPVVYYTYDNLNQNTTVEQYDGDAVNIYVDANADGTPDVPAAGNRRARTVTSFDEQGRAYRTEVFHVNPTTGAYSTTNRLRTDLWFNKRGLVIKQRAPGGLVTKSVYDGAGRQTKVYLSNGGGDPAPGATSNWAHADDVTGDHVLEQTETQYDANGNAILTIFKQHFHTNTTTGELGTPTTGALSRVYYSAAYYDLADRMTDAVDVGTNGGVAYTRPGTVPTRSDTVLVTSYGYAPTNWLISVTDPRGIQTRHFFDNLGRTTRVVQNFVDGVPSAADDRTTDTRYDGNGHVTLVRAVLPGGAVQETGYVYQARIATGSAVNSNDLLSATQHPDPTTGLASAGQQETYTVNALGQRTGFTDRNGSTHAYAYDVVGRATADAVTVLGAGVNGAIRRLETAYDSAGRAYLFTSYDASSGGNVVNQVQRTFNGYGQVTIEYQAVAGAVSTGSTPKVQYAYSTPSDTVNHSRLTTVTYPTVSSTTGTLGYVYASGVANTISRVSSLTWKGTTATTVTVESLAYLGLSTVVRRDHLEPNANLIYVKMTGEADGAAGDQYTGLDRFGRVVDQRWEQGASGHADRFQYGYDRNGNRLYRDNLLNNNYDELYHADGATAGYDGLDRLVEWQRGALSDTNADLIPDTVVTAARSQVFTLDAQGNFGTVNTNGTGVSRTHNAQNEIQTVGAANLTYDNNGNLTTDETGQQLRYDAWNRLERVLQSNGTTLINFYRHDALGRRVFEDPGLRRDFYYTTGWQLLEERLGNIAQLQTVFSPAYVDAVVLRERDAARDGTFEERLYVAQDANWNVTALITTANNVVERYSYDAYGVRTAHDQTWAVRGATAFAFTAGFQGLRHDDLTGNVHARNRDTRPTLQVWLQRDPLYTDTNWYVAFGNNPVNRVDPWGLQATGAGPNSVSVVPPFSNEELMAKDKLGTFKPFIGGTITISFDPSKAKQNICCDEIVHIQVVQVWTVMTVTVGATTTTTLNAVSHAASWPRLAKHETKDFYALDMSAGGKIEINDRTKEALEDALGSGAPVPQVGFRKANGTSRPAIGVDAPHLNAGLVAYFETFAFCRAGTDKGKIYDGGVFWMLDSHPVTGDDRITVLHTNKRSPQNDPTSPFMRAFSQYANAPSGKPLPK